MTELKWFSQIIGESGIFIGTIYLIAQKNEIKPSQAGNIKKTLPLYMVYMVYIWFIFQTLQSRFRYEIWIAPVSFGGTEDLRENHGSRRSRKADHRYNLEIETTLMLESCQFNVPACMFWIQSS